VYTLNETMNMIYQLRQQELLQLAYSLITLQGLSQLMVSYSVSFHLMVGGAATVILIVITAAAAKLRKKSPP